MQRRALTPVCRLTALSRFERVHKPTRGHGLASKTIKCHGVSSRGRSNVSTRASAQASHAARGSAGEGGQLLQDRLDCHDAEENPCGQVAKSQIRENGKRQRWGVSSHDGVTGALTPPRRHQVWEYDHSGVGQGP